MGLPLFLCALFFVFFFTIRAQLFFFLNLVMGVSSQVIKFGRLNLLNSLLSVVCLLSFAVNCETSLDSFSKSDELNASRYQTWDSQLDLPLTHTRSINLNNKMTTCRNLFFFVGFHISSRTNFQRNLILVVYSRSGQMEFSDTNRIFTTWFETGSKFFS